MAKYITFDDYSKIEEELEPIRTNSGVWYPPKEFDETIAKNISMFYKYLIWLTEYTTPISEFEKNGCKRLKALLNKNLVLVEHKSEIPTKYEELSYDDDLEFEGQEETEIM